MSPKRPVETYPNGPCGILGHKWDLYGGKVGANTSNVLSATSAFYRSDHLPMHDTWTPMLV